MNKKKILSFLSSLLVVLFMAGAGSVAGADTQSPMSLESEFSPELVRPVEIKIPAMENGHNKEEERKVPIVEEQQAQPQVQSTVPTPQPATLAPAAVSAGQTLGPNLISNPSFESSNTSATNWSKGGYGTNTRTLSFPVTGHNGSNAVKVSIGSYTSGDAKWVFDEVPVTAGNTYQFSDYYISDVPSILDVQYRKSDGTFSYADIATLAPSGGYTQASAEFTVPSGVVSVTVFHLLNRTGNLTTDDYSLSKINSPAPSTNNLIPNGDMEIAGANGAPNGWLKGGWGTNTRTFSYPVSGVNSSKAIQVQIDSATTGDAKWYFSPIVLSAGTYKYTDAYKSNEGSVLTVQYKNSDGSFSYKDIATLPASSGFAEASASFGVPANVQNVTIFHLIKGVGFLVVDNALLESQSAPSGIFTTGAVTITLDDGLVSQYQNAIPKLNSAGLSATFFIVSRQLADYGFPGSMSIAQVKSVFASGHEIGAHTRTHPYLSQLSSTDQQNEVSGSRQDLLAMNVGPIISFAYPYGDYDETTIQIVKDTGFTDARSTIGGYTSQTSSRFQLPRQGVEVTTTVAQVKQWIDTAIANKQWLILTFHGIDTSGTQYSTTPSDFNQIIDYLVSTHARVVTLAQGIGSVAP